MIGKLKGKTKYETIENYFISLIIIGAVLFSTGLGLTIFNSNGLSVIISMIGAIISFIFTIALIVLWLVNEFKEE